jgi:hypothetical protein
MTNRKPTSYGYRTTHEVYFETDSMAGLDWASPKIVEKFREIFGPATAVHLTFDAYWDRLPAEPFAGFPLPYFEVQAVEINEIGTTVDGGEDGPVVNEKTIGPDNWDIIVELCMDIAQDSGEDPENMNDMNY